MKYYDTVSSGNNKLAGAFRLSAHPNTKKQASKHKHQTNQPNKSFSRKGKNDLHLTSFKDVKFLHPKLYIKQYLGLLIFPNRNTYEKQTALQIKHLLNQFERSAVQISHLGREIELVGTGFRLDLL